MHLMEKSDSDTQCSMNLGVDGGAEVEICQG